jgi:predicted DNA-binding transcriptional regulator AlpA
VIEFPPSATSPSRKHIYTVIQDDQLPQGRVSDGGRWTYWGWWATQ